jgi:hypothetical protein
MNQRVAHNQFSLLSRIFLRIIEKMTDTIQLLEKENQQWIPRRAAQLNHPTELIDRARADHVGRQLLLPSSVATTRRRNA